MGAHCLFPHLGALHMLYLLPVMPFPPIRPGPVPLGLLSRRGEALPVLQPLTPSATVSCPAGEGFWDLQEGGHVNNTISTVYSLC